MIVKRLWFDSVEFDIDDIKQQIQSEYGPEDIFEDQELEEWATENGFVKAEDIEQ